MLIRFEFESLFRMLASRFFALSSSYFIALTSLLEDDVGFPPGCSIEFILVGIAKSRITIVHDHPIETPMSPGRGSHVMDGKPHIVIRSR